jgi:hypothetical protein
VMRMSEGDKVSSFGFVPEKAEDEGEAEEK